MSLRAFAVLVLAAPLAGCTLTLHRDERELAEFDPQGAARPALQLEVVERRGWVGHAGLWIGPGKEERVSGSALERLRARWESSGAFERVDSDEHRGPGQPAELELRLRQVRDEVARSPEGPMVLYFAPVVVPLLFVSGTHRDVLLVWDARFERDGELLAEITRAERLSVHRHWLFLPFAWMLSADAAQREAEEDLVQSILIEARRRGLL